MPESIIYKSWKESSEEVFQFVTDWEPPVRPHAVTAGMTDYPASSKMRPRFKPVGEEIISTDPEVEAFLWSEPNSRWEGLKGGEEIVKTDDGHYYIKR